MPPDLIVVCKLHFLQEKIAVGMKLAKEMYATAKEMLLQLRICGCLVRDGGRGKLFLTY